jgi:ubiquinone/menaquinone biosynthesis C-methylase UbiE
MSITTIPNNAKVEIFEKEMQMSISQFDQGEYLLTRYTALLTLDAFQRMGVFLKAGEVYTIPALKENLYIDPIHNRLFNALMEILQRAGFINGFENISTNASVVSKAVASEIKQLKASQGKSLTNDPVVWNFIQATITLEDLCFQWFPEMLTGKKSYLDVMFPGGDLSLVAAIYKGTIQLYLNKKVAAETRQLIVEKLRQNPDSMINILEVGAGTGGTTAVIFEAIKDLEKNVTFWYTDISAGFARFGKREYGEKYPFAVFQALNISNDPTTQKFEAHETDIVICNNVLHATSNMKVCLDNVSILLRSGGNLVVNDLTKKLDFNTVTFGFTKEWWNFEDESLRVPHAPVLENWQWKELLLNDGYRDVQILGVPEMALDKLHQSIIIAEKL